MTRRITLSNALATVAVFLIVAGGTAFAANQLAKSSVGKKQLKANAVTTAKIKKNAVTKAKIRKGAIDSSKVADGSLTGSDIDAASTSFGRVVANPTAAGPIALAPGTVIPIGSYTQNSGEVNHYLASLDVEFAAGCGPERQVGAYLLRDANLAAIETDDVIGVAQVTDTGTGTASKRIEFGSLPIPGFSPMSVSAVSSPIQHTFTAYVIAAKCESGGGITASGAQVTVLGYK